MDFNKFLIIMYISLLIFLLPLFFLDNKNYILFLVFVVTVLFSLIYKKYSKHNRLLKLRKKHSKQIQRNLRFTIDNFPFLVWLKDEEGKFLTVNTPFVNSCLKEHRKQVEGKTDLDLWPTNLANKYRQDDINVMQTKKQKIFKEKIFHEGSEKWFETYKSPVYDFKNNVIGTVGFAMDISQRQKYEDELKLTSVVFESSYEGIIITDENTKILKVNNAFTNITGYTQEEIYLKTPSILKSKKTSKEFYKKMWEELNKNGHWNGEIWNKNKEGELYLEWLTIKKIFDTDGNIKNYVGVFTDISLIKESRNKLNYLAFHDNLTGLGNRVFLKEQFEELLKIAKDKKLNISTFFIDLDGFKEVNDVYGHDIGDTLLQIVSKRIKNVTRTDDLIVRLGGDEFVVVILNKNDEKITEILAQKLLNTISKSYEINDFNITISASIGISYYPKNGSTLDELLKNADSAMYNAKQAGKKQYSIG